MADYKTTTRRIAVAAVCVAALASVGGTERVRAQTQTDVWTSWGPRREADISRIAIDPQTPSTLYAATTSGAGVLKSTDSGATWSVANRLGGLSIRVLAIDPQTPTTLYAGGNGNYTSGAGILKSTDGGSTWSPMNVGLTSTNILALAIDPLVPSTLYAGTFRDGVFKSTDGGASWSPANTGLPVPPPPGAYENPTVNALVIDPNNPATLYAAVNREQPVGVFRSDDGGTSWVKTGLSVTFRVYALAIDPQNPSTLYAGTYGRGVFKSTDGGVSWSTTTGGTTLYVLDLAVDPQTPTTVYFSTGSLYKSTDSGGSWRAVIVGSPDRSATTVAINPRTPAVIYGTVTGGGALKSTDGGETWNRLDTGQNVPVGVAKLVVDPQTPTTVYAGQGPSNTRTYGLFKTTDSGNTWRAINNGLLVYVGLSIWGLALDPQVPTTLYTTLANVAPNLYKTTDGGAAWIAVNNGIGKNKSGGVLAVDPQTSTVYAGAYEPFVGYSVLRSTDGGASWSSVPMASQVFVLAVDPQTPSIVYAGTGAGLFKSSDGGTSWSATELSGSIRALAVDPRASTTIYAGSGSGGVNGLYKSVDGGENWTNLLAPASFVTDLVIDPQADDIVYAGTFASGVLKSTDAGATWTPMNDGLTNLRINTLAIDPQEPFHLYAGTDSGGFAITMTPSFELTVATTGDGHGTVTSTPPGIDCGTDCAEVYSSGTTVTLTATPADDSVFTGWDGCDAVEDDGTCTVTMDRARSVTAGFDLQRFNLTVSASGSRGGTVTSNPDGIDCGSDCSDWFTIGTVVTLTAVPTVGSVQGWSGCDTDSGEGRTSTCAVTMDGDRSVNVRFPGRPGPVQVGRTIR